MSEVFEYLNGTTFYVATVDSNKPRVRPFGFVMELKGKLYFGTNDKKPSYRQLTENPNVEICASRDGKTWLRVSGKAVFDLSPETKEKAFEVAPYLKEMYGQSDAPILELFYVEDGQAIFSSLGGADRTINL
jgi:uncharacterized pyridoxamine 5'-phosphate oxidase family protein